MVIAMQEGTATTEHLVACSGKTLNLPTSLSFGGADGRTVYVGSLGLPHLRYVQFAGCGFTALLKIVDRIWREALDACTQAQGCVSCCGRSSPMVAHDTWDLVQTWLSSGFATAPSSIAPSGMPRCTGGRPAGSYHRGEPHAAQNTLRPPPGIEFGHMRHGWRDGELRGLRQAPRPRSLYPRISGNSCNDSISRCAASLGSQKRRRRRDSCLLSWWIPKFLAECAYAPRLLETRTQVSGVAHVVVDVLESDPNSMQF